MKFQIKKYSNLPSLEIKPTFSKEYKYIFENINKMTAFFSMKDENECFIINNKPAIIEIDNKINDLNNYFDTCSVISFFTLKYTFSSQETKKIGKYQGFFTLKFDDNVLIIPNNKRLTIEVLNSTYKPNLLQQIFIPQLQDFVYLLIEPNIILFSENNIGLTVN
jgi:hypothetical protein